MYKTVSPVADRWSEHEWDEHSRRDAHRRISNILDDVCPASSWNLEESRAVLGVLSCIVRARQATTVGST